MQEENATQGALRTNKAKSLFSIVGWLTDLRVWQKSMKACCENQLGCGIYRVLYSLFLIVNCVLYVLYISKSYNSLVTIYIHSQFSIYRHILHAHLQFPFQEVESLSPAVDLGETCNCFEQQNTVEVRLCQSRVA